MNQVTIKGIDIQFPYVPYDVQIAYMTKVIECLQQGVNGVLESPTGTGKTLSLLCSVLAWLETKKAQHQLFVLQHGANSEVDLNDLRSKVDSAAGLWNSDASTFMLPQIIYASRTHTQLSQAIQELKRSNYKHVKCAALGSRDQLCVHAEVSKIATAAAKHYACRSKVGTKSCPFYLNYEEKFMSLKEYQDTPVMDIEDLVVLGKKHVFCPYYAARTLRSKADIIFTPYNYIIDPKTRRAQEIELVNNVVIFDEGHNIDGACEESMSIQLKSIDLAMCISELTQTITMVKDYDKDPSNFSSTPDSAASDFTLNDLLSLKVMFCELESLIDKDIAECSAGGATKAGDYIFDILSKVELTPERREVVVELLEKITQYHTNAGASTPWGPKAVGIQKLSDLVKILYSRYSPGYTLEFKKDLAKKYRTYLHIDTPNKSKKTSDPWAVTHSTNSMKISWTVNCWCFTPEIGMQDVMAHGVHSIILTSGTLSPLPPLICELGISFPVMLENPHIVSDKQVLVAVVTQGPDGTPLNSSYQNRFSEKYIASLGRSITNLCRVIPNGVLVFFPSYSVMRGNIDKWSEMGVWQSLSGVKPVFVEPQGKDAFHQSMQQFYTTIDDPQSKGAALLAVCRGKVSEGLDFSDNNARGVIITGLPFPPSLDPKVKLKMAYLDSIAKETKGLQGNEWYCLQASRAINQAIGRVIRHKQDYGAILLCDNRFAQKRIQGQLSKWVQGRIKVFDSFGPAFKHVSIFFKQIDPTPSKHSNQRQLGSFSSNAQTPVRTDIKGGVASCSNSRNATNNDKREDCGNKSLFQGYLNSDSKTATASPQANNPKSIFDAFDQFVTDDAVDQDQTPSKSSGFPHWNSLKATPSTNSGLSDAKRRKINIALRRADQPENEHGDSKLDEREMWKKYLKEVKTVLESPILYSKFCSSVKDYKMSKNTARFAREMKEVFCENVEKAKYLQRTSLLVASQERHKFLALCSELETS